MTADLLALDDVHVTYSSRRKTVEAVRGVSFTVPRGGSVGLVGESGCGKSSLAAAILRLGVETRGEITFDGHNVRQLDARSLRQYRRRVQVVFQDPMGALDPRQTVGNALAEVLVVHRPSVGRDASASRARCEQLMDLVGLASDFLGRYPHEMSGGQRQRVGIARALAVEPELLVADEPVSALDVSVQAQVLNLLRELQTRLGLTMLFIAHDLAVVRYMCETVHVMYAGLIMESGPAADVFHRPRHPYSAALVACEPDIARGLAGQGIASVALAPPTSDARAGRGCPFAQRCPKASELCHRKRPELDASPHRAACFHPLDAV